MSDPLVILRFLFVGGSTGLLFFGVTYVLVEELAVQAAVASTIAYVLAGFYNYLLHYHWTFSTDAPHGKVLTKYLLTCAGGLALNALIMHAGVMLGSVHFMLVQFVAVAAVVCWSLCVSTLWVFSRK